MALDNHLNKPKVIKFIGKSKIFMRGLIKMVVRERASPQRSKVTIPCSKIIPLAIFETKNKDTVSIT